MEKTRVYNDDKSIDKECYVIDVILGDNTKQMLVNTSGEYKLCIPIDEMRQLIELVLSQRE